MTKRTITIPNERAPGWNAVSRMHWAAQRKRNQEVWLAVRAAVGSECQLVCVPVDIHIVATFKGNPLDSDNVCSKFLIDAIKSKRLPDGSVDQRILRDDDPRYVRRVTTESKRGKHNQVEIILTEVTE
jgi:hypothetical protein